MHVAKSYRFDVRSGIGQLAKAINRGQPSAVDEVLKRNYGDINHHPLTSDQYNQMLQTVVEEYGHYLRRLERVMIDPLALRQKRRPNKRKRRWIVSISVVFCAQSVKGILG